MSDWDGWSKLRQESRPHLVPWEPVWSPDTLTKSSFRARLRQYARDAKEDVGHAFFIFRNEDHQLVGSITLSNIRRGVAQTGTIGYWTGQPYIRQGYMCEGICALLPELFDKFGLRRIEAACLPDNIPSASLLEKIGFSHEGHARQYLCINGIWQDHLLFAIIKGDAMAIKKSSVASVH
ncbi:MAG: GNAT family N-acetyltransferase [Sneathiella sp.]|nr:GNAT family N-acetyltransferase [Sneathiella sp.]